MMQTALRRLLLGVGEDAAVGQRPLLVVEVGVGGAGRRWSASWRHCRHRDADDWACGRHRATPATCAWIASTSAISNAARRGPPPPRPKPWPGRTMQHVGAEAGNLLCTAAVAPLPSVTIVTTAATPMTMPSDGQERAQQVAADRAQREEIVCSAASVAPADAAGAVGSPATAGCGFGASLSMRPSRKCTMVPAHRRPCRARA